MRKGNILFFASVTLFILLFAGFVSAANCWQYTSIANGCNSTDGCKWKNDSWSVTGWCEELNCWSLYTQSDCQNTVVPEKNCTWQGGGVTYGCEKLSCWSLSGTNAATCENNSLSLSCQWSNYCYSSGIVVPGYSGGDCWSKNTSADCLNATGCAWGQCMEKGCWSYASNTTCNAAKDWNGKNCIWDSYSLGQSWCECTLSNCPVFCNDYSSNKTACDNNVSKGCLWRDGWCNQNGCWKYWQNETYCTSNPSGLSCAWKWNSCQDLDCYNWDFTNETACVNNTANLTCTWGGSYCMKKDCWNYNTQANCQNQSSCTWKSYSSSGSCQEVNCWTWDSYNNGSQSKCENNDAAYGLECIWGIDPANLSRGWCYKDISSVSCSNKTTERECMDTFYCWWQSHNWSDMSSGGECNEPGNWNVAINTSIFQEWNPGCYIFDMNSSDCNNIFGCNFTNGECDELNDTYGGNISANGINCSYINDSRLCNNIPVLSSCCVWQNGTCMQNKLSTTCRDQMQQKTEDSCEDAETSAKCEQIAGSPWYMPCKWNNSTEKCDFKASNVFGNGTQSLMIIDNKMNCEAAGGKWLTENYCEGNLSVPIGRCEYKFDEEDNCDKACFACELKSSDGNTVNSSNAESACKGSKLGICEFHNNTNAPNGIGYCKAKEQFKKGIATDCNSDCGACTFKGDPLSNDSTKKPSYYCADSKANLDAGGCKWVSDNSTSTGGYCLKKGEKTCEDSCDRCTSQTNCANLGRTAVANQSGSCKWQGATDTGSCVPNIGEDVEVCWDGIDNTNDNLIDCADSSCFADSYCGFVSGDCFGWLSNTSCINNGCEWVTDNWGSWCDSKGTQCWKYEFSEANCSSQTNCQWHNGTGSAWCERDWSKGEVCMGLNQAACMAANASGCNWTVDSWCSGTGNGTEWCNSNGGWCDYNAFKPKNCWAHTSGASDCNSASGCTWKTDQYSSPHCEVNWSANCWQYTSNNTCSTNLNCIWDVPPQGGGWCMNKADKCWSYNQSNCDSVLDGRCYWQSWMGGTGGSCQAICWNGSFNTNNTCNSLYGCVWKQESGWCEESSPCTNLTNSNNQTRCQADSECRWKSSGWCDPKGGGFSGGSMAGGGGVGTAMGGDCFKYDGNQTLCTNKTIINISCGWSVNLNPTCEVDWSKNCWQYTSVENGCNSTNGCWWKNDTWGSFCTNIMDQCWQNQSYQSWNNTAWLANCTSNPYCNNNSWGGCEPKCFSQNTTTCNASLGCRAVSGWCNPSGMNEMFDNMEAGMPAPLGQDTCPEDGKQASVDICGFGMKDMGDSYGFGAGMANFENASVCNKEKLSSFVMGGMAGGGGGAGVGVGGGGGTFGMERIGSGNDTVIYLVYLDTDGSTTGGCTLDFNSSAVGYEFRFKYTSQWNANTSKASETFNAEKCDNSNWKATDIKLSAWKQKMCSDIGGAMLAVKKADLDKYPTLYDSTKDMRIYVATIGNTGNLTSPTDTCGPGWTTPGSVDFEIKSAFDYGADTAKFEDILKKGFVQGEDCFNSIDDDNDGNIDCNDWDCLYATFCLGRGVNATNYTDTSSPLVTGIKIEEYPDAALIMFDTNKPTNGTLELYNYGDIQCLNRTYLIYDTGILSENVRDYKLWHTALVYDANNTNISLNWPLAPGSTYNYKLKVCDSSGRCAVSKCSAIKTPASEQKCGYCNFVTRIKAPTGWKVSYDVDRNGNYEHVQGEVCGPNAGMKTNYTAGRKVNIKLAKTDGSVYIEFLNASLTKTGLNDKVRTISTVGDIIHSTTGNYVGLTSETRDKIINNLHPEACKIKIPVASGAVCDKLYHCDDNGVNCTDRTAAAGGVPLDAAECLWNLPFCEFSTYKTSSAVGGTTTGGGGGGGGGLSATYTLTAEQFSSGYTKEIAKSEQFKVNISSQIHYVKFISYTNTTASINVTSKGQEATLSIGEKKDFDVTEDGVYDLSVTLNSINVTSKKASFSIKKLIGAAAEATPTPTAIQTPTPTPTTERPAGITTGSKTWLWILIIAIIIIIIIILLVARKRR